MVAIKELILFIPGLGATERDEYVSKLTNGLIDYCTHSGINHTINDEALVDGSKARQIKLDSQNRSIDIREIFWSDLAPSLSSESIIRKIIRGFTLLWYWVFSLKVWKVIKDSKYMLFSMIFTIIVVLFWYYGAITTALKAVAENPQFFGAPIPPYVKDILSHLEGNLSGWNIWITASILLAIVPVTEILDISYFTKAYLQNRESLYHKIYGRISLAVHGIDNLEKEYDRITIVAHSFGVVVGTEYLANCNTTINSKFRFVTLGGPLLVVAAKEPRVRKAIIQLVKNENVESWTDFYSTQDWLCTYSPVPNNTKNYTAISITSSVAFDRKLSGASHDLYFQDRDVMKSIIEDQV